MSRAAKAEAYDRVEQERQTWALIAYDQANPDKGVRAVESAMEVADDGEVFYVLARGFRLTGGTGGLVLLESWCETAGDLSPGSAREVNVSTLDDLLTTYVQSSRGHSPSVRAIRAVTIALRAARNAAYDRERAAHGATA